MYIEQTLALIIEFVFLSYEYILNINLTCCETQLKLQVVATIAYHTLYMTHNIHGILISNFYLKKTFILANICRDKSINNLLFQCSITLKLIFSVLQGMNMKANRGGGIWNNSFGMRIAMKYTVSS